MSYIDARLGAGARLLRPPTPQDVRTSKWSLPPDAEAALLLAQIAVADLDGSLQAQAQALPAGETAVDTLAAALGELPLEKGSYGVENPDRLIYGTWRLLATVPGAEGISLEVRVDHTASTDHLTSRQRGRLGQLALLARTQYTAAQLQRRPGISSLMERSPHSLKRALGKALLSGPADETTIDVIIRLPSPLNAQYRALTFDSERDQVAGSQKLRIIQALLSGMQPSHTQQKR